MRSRGKCAPSLDFCHLIRTLPRSRFLKVFGALDIGLSHAGSLSAAFMVVLTFAGSYPLIVHAVEATFSSSEAFRGAASAHLEKKVCPNRTEFQAELDQRFGVLESLRTNLIRLENGETITEISPGALFTVDIENLDSVSQRIQELTQLSQSQGSLGVSAYPAASCFSDDLKLQRKIHDLLELENQVNRLRLTFLKLSDERRYALLSIQEEASHHAEGLRQILLEKLSAQKRIEAADLALRHAEERAQKASSKDLRELAAKRAILEKNRRQIAELSVKWAKELQDLSGTAKVQTEVLAKHASVLGRKSVPTEQIREAYFSVATLWRTLLENLLSHLGDLSARYMVPDVATAPDPLLIILESEQEANEYQLSLKQAVLEQEDLINLRNRIEFLEKAAQYRLLLSAGRVRSQLMRELIHRGDLTAFEWNNDYFADLAREFRLIPYRPLVVARSFLIDVREMLSGGISGVLALTRRLFILVLFFSTPFVSFSIMKKGAQWLDRLRGWLIRSRARYSQATFFAIWIHRVNPYIPWILMIVATWLASMIVAGTSLEGVSEILPYFQYFFFYRIFRLLTTAGIISVTSYAELRDRSRSLLPRIEKTARWTGLFFLISAYLVEATQTAARKALFYYLVWDTLFWLTPLLLAVGAYWWRQEIAEATLQILPEGIAQRMKRGLLGRWSFFLSLPYLILLISILGVRKVVGELSELDTAKRVSAQIFRRKLESAAKGSSYQKKSDPTSYDLSPKYLDQFALGALSDAELFISPESVPYDEIVDSIKKWSEEKSDEHTLAIHGEKGIGKTCLLQRLEATFPNHRVIRFAITEKMIHQKAVLSTFGEALGVDLTDWEKGVKELDSRGEKTIILVDECQNLFLGKRGGFEAFRLITTLFNAPTEHLFWCAAFNRYSWVYLNAVTGGSQFFRHVFSMDRWSDTDIRNLILRRHERSGYRLQYDPIIFAMDGQHRLEQTSYIQDRFFELLWEQSKGNPRTALTLWLSAIEELPGNTIRVGIPTASPVRPLAGLTDDELFVISAVIRHENLTSLEAGEVTSLPRGTIQHAFGIGIERGFLERTSSSGRYRVLPLWQGPLIQHLISKNFLYE